MINVHTANAIYQLADIMKLSITGLLKAVIIGLPMNGVIYFFPVKNVIFQKAINFQ
jgi:hypothetical protein